MAFVQQFFNIKFTSCINYISMRSITKHDLEQIDDIVWTFMIWPSQTVHWIINS